MSLSSVLQLKKHVVTIDSYAGVKSNDEKALLEAVAAQPVSVGICGSERAFQLYSSVSCKDSRFSPTLFSECSMFSWFNTFTV